jgi:hypothetical protein
VVYGDGTAFRASSLLLRTTTVALLTSSLLLRARLHSLFVAFLLLYTSFTSRLQNHPTLYIWVCPDFAGPGFFRRQDSTHQRRSYRSRDAVPTTYHTSMRCSSRIQELKYIGINTTKKTVRGTTRRPRATCHMPHATRYILHATCYTLHATCYMLHATCHMLHATPHMLLHAVLLTYMLHATPCTPQ